VGKTAHRAKSGSETASKHVHSPGAKYGVMASRPYPTTPTRSLAIHEIARKWAFLLFCDSQRKIFHGIVDNSDLHPMI
jgi:hypothetical protein